MVGVFMKIILLLIMSITFSSAHAMEKIPSRMTIILVEEKIKEGLRSNSLKQAKESFFLAVYTGNIGLVKRFLQKHKNLVHKKNKEQKTALIIAAENGNLPLAEVLVVAGADPNSLSKKLAILTYHFGTMPSGLSPLIYAAVSNNVCAIQILLAVGANPDLLLKYVDNNKFFDSNQTSRSALMEAASFGCYESVVALVNGIPYPFATLAHIRGNYFHLLPYDLCNELSKYSKLHADPYIKDKKGVTALQLAIAAREHSIDVLRADRGRRDKVVAFLLK